MIKLDENGNVVYTDPLEDVTEEVPADEELPELQISDTERIEALEAAILELAEVVLNG